jgi:hypothetical protein
MGDSKIHDDASVTEAEAGIVIVDGPDGVMLSLSPDAAEETANRLRQSAAKARDQRSGIRPPFDNEVAPNFRTHND